MDEQRTTFRIPPAVMKALLIEAAQETVKRKRRVSVNGLVVEILERHLRRAGKPKGKR